MKHTFIHENDGYDIYFEILSRAQNALETIYPTNEAAAECRWYVKQNLMYLEGELGDAAASNAEIGTFDFDVYTELDFDPNKSAASYEENIAAAEYIRGAATELAGAVDCNIDSSVFEQLIEALGDDEDYDLDDCG